MDRSADVEYLGLRFDNLSSIPRIQVRRKRRPDSTELPSDLHKCIVSPAPTHP